MTRVRAELTARIRKEAARIIRKNRKDLGHLSRDRLTLSIRFHRRNHCNGHGSFYPRTKVHVSVNPITTPWWAIVWLLTHELAHLVRGTAPRGTGRKRIVHGPLWQAAFCRLAEKAHGIECWSGCSDRVVWSAHRGVDKVLRDALEARS